MSILSFEDRGKWGDNSWPGNCSGHVYQAIFNQLRPSVVIDPMAGSGTCQDVCDDIGIECHSLDLKNGFNILRQSIVDAAGKQGDCVISHPPYHSIITYSGKQYGQAHADDLSRCEDYEDFLDKLQIALLNQRAATVPGGVYATIIGDMRKKGAYYAMQADAISLMPKGELKSVLIKAQHNTRSGLKSYTNMKFPFIEHEYVVLWEAPKQIMSFVDTLRDIASSQQRRLTGSWRAVVQACMVELGGKVGLDEIYGAVFSQVDEAKLEGNAHVKEKIRQTLQHGKAFTNVERGVWALAA